MTLDAALAAKVRSRLADDVTPPTSARVAALAFSQQAPPSSVFARFSLKAAAFACVLALGAVAANYTAIKGAFDDSTQLAGQNVSYFAITPGVPFRIHIPGFLRVDTGLYLPLSFDASTSFSLDIPAQAFFALGDAFVGPVTGIRFNAPGGGIDSSVDIPLGIAGGYTLGGRVDLKVQLRTERINDANWASQFLGGGFGVGLRLP